MNKKGISLIVLVITIIVMIILAASVVITLSNTGIINKANDAVNATNLKEVQNLAQLLWSEAYIEGEGKWTAEQLQNYINEKLGSDIQAKYEIVATTKGVTVTLAIDPTGIEVADGTVTVNGTLDLATKVTYAPEGARNKPLTWEITAGSEYADIANGVLTGKAAGTVTVKATITGTSTNDTATITVEAAPTLASASTSYVGYYADIDGIDGIDGVIYADLLAGKSNEKWSDTNTSEYDYRELEDYKAIQADSSQAKTYTVSATTFEGVFGTKNVIKLASDSTGTIDRFYVMALEDFETSDYSSFYWYKGAYGNMVATDTSKNFGEGKTNTSKMIDYWNKKVASSSGTAATQDDKDMWGVIQTKVDKGWFVPSFQEWTAFAVFAKGIGLTTSNYNSKYKLQNYYWSSSQNTTGLSWGTGFFNGCMYSNTVNSTYGVRLSVTF